MIVRQAVIDDLDTLVPLFDAYRRFYGNASDPAAARTFLRERFAHQQPVIFIACEVDRATGFTQLYPLFSSARMARTFVLNDLFVCPEARRTGAGRALLKAAQDYGQRVGAARLSLSTAISNATAQALYEDAGWTADTTFRTYAINLTEPGR